MARGSGPRSKSNAPASARTTAPPAAVPPTPAHDVRRWIYSGLDLVFATLYAVLIIKVIPNRLPSAWFHLWTLPVLTAGLGVGTLMRRRVGWWIAIASGSLLLVSTILLITRILISAAFLAGVYGAFGKAAAMSSLVAVALIVEVVALLPLVQIKFLMSRKGRRCYGVPLP